jgi:hypothetical protein
MTIVIATERADKPGGTHDAAKECAQPYAQRGRLMRTEQTIWTRSQCSMRLILPPQATHRLTRSL